MLLLRSLYYVVQAPHELKAVSVSLAHIKSVPDLPTAPQPTGASHSALESPPPPTPLGDSSALLLLLLLPLEEYAVSCLR